MVVSWDVQFPKSEESRSRTVFFFGSLPAAFTPPTGLCAHAMLALPLSLAAAAAASPIDLTLIEYQG